MHQIFDRYRKTWQDHWAHQRPERFLERAIRRAVFETRRSQHAQSTRHRKQPKLARRNADAPPAPSVDSFLEFSGKPGYFKAARRKPTARVSERCQR
jgi:hypothetical protein